MNFGPHIHSVKPIGIAVTIHPVGKKNIYQLIFRIYPGAGAGKTGMAKSQWRSGKRGVWIAPAVILLGLIKPQPSPAGAMISGKQVDSGFFKELDAIHPPAIHQYLA